MDQVVVKIINNDNNNALAS